MTTGWIDSSSEMAVYGENTEGVGTIDATQWHSRAAHQGGHFLARWASWLRAKSSLGRGCSDLSGQQRVSLIRKVVGSCQIYVCHVRKGKKVRILTQGKEGRGEGEGLRAKITERPAAQPWSLEQGPLKGMLPACLWANRKDLEEELLNLLHWVFLWPWKVRHVLTWGYLHSCWRDKMFPLKWDNDLRPWMIKCQVSATHSTSYWNSGKGALSEGWMGWGGSRRECETWTRLPSFKKSRGPLDK